MPRFLPLTATDPHAVAGYHLRARLGGGGMGQVYLSFTPGGRPIAIKVVRSEFADDEEFRRRFRQEIQAIQRVQGLYTAPVLDADPDASVPWLATAYVAGPSLHRAVSDSGPLPALTVFRLLAGVAEALIAVHSAGLIHRDLTPSNVILADDGPRVIDFGIALAADATTLTRSGLRIGSPAFMAPEQIEGEAVTPATDVFALGQLALYAATGRTAFGEGNEAALAYRIVNQPADLSGCPPEMHDLVDSCLAKDPARRPTPQDVIDISRAHTAGATLALAESWLPTEVATTLAEYDASAAVVTRVPGQPAGAASVTVPVTGATMPVLTAQYTAMAAPLRPARRRRGRAVAVIGVVAVIIAAGATMWALSGHPGPTAQAGASGITASSQPASPMAVTAGPEQPDSRDSGAPFTSLGNTSYISEFQKVQFDLPGGTQGFSPLFGDYVGFDQSGPQVENDEGVPVNPIILTYAASDAPPVLDGSQGVQLGTVDGTPDASDCVQDARQRPINGLSYQDMTVGMGVCVFDPGDMQVVFMTLAAKVDSTYALSWVATAWKISDHGY